MNPFPSHNIDPKKKDKQWHLNYAKAAWNDTKSRTKMFYHNAKQYDEIRSYAHGCQATGKYRKFLHVDEQSNTTQSVVDERVFTFLKKHRQVALGRLQKSGYNIVCTPIDALARGEADQYFADVRAKILMRDALMEANPELAKSPLLQPMPGEALDLEELEMQMDFGFRHNYAMEAEQGIQLMFDQNNISVCRERVIEDLFDFGVAVYKDWMDVEGNCAKIRFRNCDVRSIITNNCKYPDFSDLQYAGEVLDIPWTDFKVMAGGEFNSQQLEEIENKVKTAYSSSRTSTSENRSLEAGKVRVLDLEFFSVDEIVWENGKNKYENPTFTKTDFNNKGKEGTVTKSRKTVYKCKWVLDTDYIFHFGPKEFQKRDNSLAKAELSYHIVATNFHDMRASGVMQDIIPIADQIQIAWLKLQNIRAQLIPYVIDIDLNAVEDVAIGKGGDGGNMSPKEVIQMMFQRNILINRKRDMAGNPNYKSIDIHETPFANSIAAAWNDLTNNISLISQATGFNEATDGSTPNAKNLTATTNAMVESTNNALYHISNAEKILLLKLARAVLCRMRRAIKMGKVEGFIKAMGTNTTKFISVSPDLDLHDFGIMLEDKPTTEQKMMLQQLMIKGMGEGVLDATDVIMIENTYNLKQAEQILAFRIKKRKAEKEKHAMMMAQQTGQIQVQSAQAAEQAKQATLQLEYDLKLRNEMQIKQLEMQLEAMRLEGKGMIQGGVNETKERMQKREMGEQVIEPMAEVPLPQEPTPEQIPPQEGAGEMGVYQ